MVVVGERQRGRIPAGGNEADYGAVRAVLDMHHGNRVVIGVGDVEQLALVVDGQRVGRRTLRRKRREGVESRSIT